MFGLGQWNFTLAILSVTGLLHSPFAKVLKYTLKLLGYISVNLRPADTEEKRHSPKL